jgi:anti-sigma regulatory factor (Ser/Thr protein kinase)
MEAKRRATFEGDYRSLAKIGQFVVQAAQDADLDPKAVYKVQTAVDEACTNIIEHAYADDPHGEIGCTCTIRAGELVITLTDTGEAFDPTQAPKPDLTSRLEDRQVGGLGIHLIRSMMDEVSYTVEGSSNKLTLTKRARE